MKTSLSPSAAWLCGSAALGVIATLAVATPTFGWRCAADARDISAVFGSNAITVTNNASDCRYVATAVYRLYADGTRQRQSYYSNLFEFQPGETRTYTMLPIPYCDHVIDIVAGNPILVGPSGPAQYGNLLIAEHVNDLPGSCGAFDTNVLSYQAPILYGLIPASPSLSSGASPTTLPVVLSTPTPAPSIFVSAPAPSPVIARQTPAPMVFSPSPIPLPSPATRPSVIGKIKKTTEEAGAMQESKDSDWWVNSGAYFMIDDRIGRTVQGNLPADNPWRVAYAAANPVDTDNGYHPQNIFRLVTRTAKKNVTQEGYFRINEYHDESKSPNRAEHNGLLFFSRYKNSGNLYYAGIRVDGNMVIKKKVNGTYHTLALVRVYPGTYDRALQPNLIPERTWIGLKTVVADEPGGVRVRAYMDRDRAGTWTLVAEAVDDGASWGPLLNAGYAGTRTDFMDVEIADMRLVSQP
ncbi:MAG: hypothetical protein Q8Q39_00665 [bacterium]|nr:hypothetical protein [bacterium]